MPVIAFANLKGGVGKTTLAVNVAGALVTPTRRVALIDADPQGSAAEWAGQGRLSFAVLSSPVDAGRACWIKAALAVDADMVVIDLPPMLGDAAAAALAIADVVAVPVTPSGADLKATGRALELARKAQGARDGKPRVVLVPSKVDRRTAAGAEVEAVLHDFGVTVAPVIAQRIAHVDAFTAGQWIGDYAPGSVAHIEIKALAAVLARMAGR